MGHLNICAIYRVQLPDSFFYKDSSPLNTTWLTMSASAVPFGQKLCRSPMEINHRRCISCRKTAPKSEFWRIVRLHPAHTIVLDQGMGRSAYLCPTPDCLKAAKKKDRLSRVLKAPIPDQIYQTLHQRLRPLAFSIPSTDPSNRP
jgi:uncharacterized protein